MKWVSYAQNIEELQTLIFAGLSEVIFSTRDFSRDINTSTAGLRELLDLAKEHKIKTVFEWDTIDTQSQFEIKARIFEQLPLALIDVVRVKDPGVLNYILETTHKPVQFIRENSDHNELGLKTWLTLMGERCDRLVLSNELNKAKLAQYKKKLGCNIEILAYGKILLFYTPRALLSPLAKKSDEINAFGTSEESPHSGFPLKENQHGTFMYHIKDLYLLDKIEELEETGIDIIRFDLRDKDIKLAKEIVAIDTNTKGVAFKAKHVPKSTRGYFQVNKTDVLFKKLKNYRVQRKDASYLGEVLEIQNKEYMAMMVRADKITKDSKVRILSPDGKEYTTQLASLRNSNMEDQTEIAKGHIAILKYKGGVWPKSQVYLQ